MPHVVHRRSPLGVEIARRRNGERAVGVVSQPRQLIVDEERRPLPADERSLERRQHRARIDVAVEENLMLAGLRIGHGLDDVAERGIGSDAVRCRVEVQPARQARAVLETVGQRHPVHFQEALVDTSADARDARHLIAGVEQVLVDGRDRAEPAGIGIRRVEDVQFLLADAVHAQRLLVGAGRQPVVEDARAGAERRLARRRRGPRHAEARTDVGDAADMRLRFVPQAGTERQVFPRADVVLDVEAELHVPERQVRIADAPRVVARTVGEIRVHVVEGVRPQIIRRRVGSIPPTVEDDAGAPGLPAAHVIQI